MSQAPRNQVAYITLRLMDNGEMSIEGNVGDVGLAAGMLASARQSVLNRMGAPKLLDPLGKPIAIPNREVDAPEGHVYPLEAVGSKS